ncbi:MAG: FAD-dependent oxidoreductase, partial [Pseudomonadota bacterium]
LSERKVAEIAETVLPSLPCLPKTPFDTDFCHYMLTPTGDFILDRLPAHPQIILCSACSGHGFKFAPVLGEMVASMVSSHHDPPEQFKIPSHVRRQSISEC